MDEADIASERGELHFLAALVDELMRKLHVAGLLNQADLNAIEEEVANGVGTTPRAW